MKKFIIKNADGSSQYVMPAIHDTRKKAEETLMGYIHSHNKFTEEYLSLFDFIIEVEEIEDHADLNKLIPDFEQAKQIIGSSEFILAKESLRFSDIELNIKHIGSLIALNQLFTIAQAWNKLDCFTPEQCQEKWSPWFKYNKNTERFVYECTTYWPVSANATFGLRVCFKSRERAEQFGRQFVDLYNQVFLL